ncbi:hypothetical protein Ddye_026987 [Dipteronia dyeriana]|uniref:Reverse transcriptase zinc-binding domain-containing protein n=1 Tax=Dipteronia dyeriana TaxID=168575 RepID=A0AAD9TNQ9_9ROSI|nr:hypothetical protein Ddye_026987 [Dipteronia dyeriana]
MLQSQLDELLNTEERNWRQRVRVEWLVKGDKNTRFFHSKASTRKAINRITGLLVENGNWKETKQGLEEIIGDSLLFTKVNDENCATIQKILEKYSKASRHVVKFDKSTMCVSPSISLLQQHFLPEDAEAILKIPTGPSGSVDTMLLHYEGNGRYNVKSGVCFDWIPTSANLARRKVSVSGRCHVCNDAADSTLHALWNCKNMKAIRNYLMEYHTSKGSNTNAVIGEKQRQRIWIPPSQGQYKTNCSTIIDKRKWRIGFEIVDMMNTGNGVAVSGISRSANSPAYVLVREALKFSEDVFWMEKCPRYLDDLLKVDMHV